MKFFNPDARDLLVRGNLRDHKENNKSNIRPSKNINVSHPRPLHFLAPPLFLLLFL